MGTYGAASAKPQIAFSNARAISGLWIGRLDKKATPQILTTRFVNKRGKRCFTGNKKLKASQPHPKSSDQQIVYRIAFSTRGIAFRQPQCVHVKCSRF